MHAEYLPPPNFYEKRCIPVCDIARTFYSKLLPYFLQNVLQIPGFPDHGY